MRHSYYEPSETVASAWAQDETSQTERRFLTTELTSASSGRKTVHMSVQERSTGRPTSLEDWRLQQTDATAKPATSPTFVTHRAEQRGRRGKLTARLVLGADGAYTREMSFKSYGAA